MKWTFDSIEDASFHLENCALCHKYISIEVSGFCKPCNILYSLLESNNDYGYDLIISFFHKDYEILFCEKEIAIYCNSSLSKTIGPLLSVKHISKFIKNIDKYLALQ